MSHFVIEQWKEYPILVPGKVRYAVSNYGRLKSFTDTIENGKILKGAPTSRLHFWNHGNDAGLIKKFNKEGREKHKDPSELQKAFLKRRLEKGRAISIAPQLVS